MIISFFLLLVFFLLVIPLAPIWLGRQKKRKQVTTVQITAYDAATTYGIGIPASTGPTVTTIAAGSANATATNLAAAWNLGTNGAPFNRVTASASTDTVTLTAINAGEPFTVASFVSGGAGTIGAATTSTTNQSPNDWNDAVNWSTAAVPGAADTVNLDDADVDALWNLDANTAVVTAINVFGTWNASLGLPKLAAGNYWEYRPRYMTLQATTVNIGRVDGRGPNLYMHDNSATACTWNIWGSGQNPEREVPCCLLLGSSASNVLNQNNGSVGVAFFGGETANLSGGINLAGGSCVCGSGVTLSGITQTGGTLDTASALGVVTQSGGSHVHRAGNITTLTLNGGTFEIRSDTALTITNLTIGETGLLDLALCTAAVTVTNTASLRPGWQINDPNNCLGRGGSFSYTETGGFGSGQLTRNNASATVTVA